MASPAAPKWDWVALSQSASNGASGGIKQQPQQRQQPGHLARREAPSVATTVTVSARSSSPTQPSNAPSSADVEAFSGVRIRDRAVPADELKTEMEGRAFVKLCDMDAKSKAVMADDSQDWVTIGVVVRKTVSKAAASGSSFMVWALSDLEGTELGVFLFGDAYSAYWREDEGTIMAILNAAALPSSDRGNFALKVSNADQVCKLGVAVDFGICKGTTSSETRCKLAVNTAKTHFCNHHITDKFIKAGRGRQQLNNNVGGFRKNLLGNHATQKNISTGVYNFQGSGAGGAKGEWKPIETKKRKLPGASATTTTNRPLMVSPNGTVLQGVLKTARPSVAQPKKPSLDALSRLTSAQGSENPDAPRRLSRGEKMMYVLSKFLVAGSKSVGGQAPALKKKKVDMMQFMRSGPST
ncbi:TPA: hypothetical protein N0F65_005514 [Lagenidium giganteum]|uniref:Zinc finger Mcm10/DnaG-type domain-containing protein n=1 Tax=Lagenidium giganteum TaxID=4803 RepID=A0AAV2YKD6_9STRA|nr:TPA: hypothetical protein N0F65_005514 [Lagenidium giganteum]